ncbi:MAG: SDR family NAD(P)-dependent oxidoreductase, partial [Rhodoblastus sp.]|nr:SDR family NAD(P)-dependent oxidoreductase [Rhodoblastus sp.]
MPLTGQTALVSGAARGIGRAIALRLARDGADVALIDINPAIEETVTLVRALGRKAVAARVDIADATAVRGAVARIAADLG